MKITPVGFVARRRTEIINQPNSSLKKLSKPLQNDIHALWKLFNSTNGPHWEWCSVKYGQIWDFSSEDIDPCRPLAAPCPNSIQSLVWF
jgi:hypothetical protein